MKIKGSLSYKTVNKYDMKVHFVTNKRIIGKIPLKKEIISEESISM